ncbi:EcsC family protein [Neptunomonas qingdaonensis]|uniref:EcsC protein family protein n=1 Tax=Neptunomonas qingdaonensis TaxID=1045558 RepID=A0A1I2S309_9GAMM|nr:EcsC family protein [Neptunomonas qingdaonensis]SFG47254.1 EcsC protein family protein [Neptunomonas qingdaonensis]
MEIAFPESDRKELQSAKNLLENPGVAAKVTNFIGTPIEKGLGLLPDNWKASIGDVTKTALMKASDAAIFTMKDLPGESSSNIWHKLGVAASGGVGGFFGIAAIAVELPISTTIMLRSIADIARSEGESISEIEAKLACLEVFALGGPSESDDGTESGYYAVRAVLAKSIADAAEFLTAKTITEEGAPFLIRFIAKVAERFSVQITQKAAAQALPAIGAAGGAIINTVFMDHFQDMAKGHFVVRRLERKHGKDLVQKVYQELPKLG